MAYGSSIHNVVDSLAEILIFSPVVPVGLLISTSAYKFSKAANLLEIQPDTALYIVLRETHIKYNYLID
jgi:hypothetical protein